MDFKDQIRQLGERTAKLKEQLLTEEATKNAFIMPFLQILGAGNAQGDEEWALSPYIGRSIRANQDSVRWEEDWDTQRKKLSEIEKLYGV